jgi:hypothetical protein
MECVVINCLDASGYCKGGTRLQTDEYSYANAAGSHFKKYYFSQYLLNVQSG